MSDFRRKNAFLYYLFFIGKKECLGVEPLYRGYRNSMFKEEIQENDLRIYQR